MTPKIPSVVDILEKEIIIDILSMSRKGPKVVQGMLDFEEDVFMGVKSH